MVLKRPEPDRALQLIILQMEFLFFFKLMSSRFTMLS